MSVNLCTAVGTMSYLAMMHDVATKPCSPVFPYSFVVFVLNGSCLPVRWTGNKVAHDVATLNVVSRICCICLYTVSYVISGLEKGKPHHIRQFSD